MGTSVTSGMYGAVLGGFQVAEKPGARHDYGEGWYSRPVTGLR
jgi:hypothetical protein